MRINNILSIVAAFSLLLSGCGQEDAYLETTVQASRPALSLRVNAAAYHPSIETRAIDAGITTTFAYGDQLALIVTHPDNSVEHLVYTYDGSTWIGSGPGSAYYDPQASYAAYYPYKEALRGKPLSEVKSAFTPLTDQSDYATGYAASDLMTCESATLDKTEKTLSITLTHVFSMLRFPVTNISVKSKCEDGNTYEYSASATDVVFHIGDTPYRAWMGSDGYARLIVSGSSSNNDGITVKSSYTFLGKRVETSGTVSSFVPGRYYTLTPPATDLGEYKLSDARVGDFYIKTDGGTGFVLPQEASSCLNGLNCLGIVLKAGRDSDGNWKDDCTYKQKGTTTDMTTIHGYVLALYDANGGGTCTWGSQGTKVEYKVNEVDMMNRDQNIGFYGYKNTQAIISFNNDKSGTLSTAFPATYAAVNYENETKDSKSCAAPANSSGWFLPSAGQCKYWLDKRDTLLANVKKATGNGSYTWNNNKYWSSSEGGDYPAYDAWCVRFTSGGGDVGNVTKDNTNSCYVRACLAF
ncbi:fimbrillin family protein [Parabacteroides sp.]